MDRQATVKIALGGAEFYVERFDSVERISELFVILVEGFSTEEIDFLDHLGKPVSLDVSTEHEHVRYFHGLLTDAVQLNTTGDGVHYRLTLRPWPYFLTRNRNYRIFQDKSVLDIAKQVFSDCGFPDYDFSALNKSYEKRDYCVQYKESDFNFLSRLFEDEGIYYFFRHDGSSHKLILGDGRSVHKAAPGFETIAFHPVTGDQTGEQDTLWTWSERVSSGGEAKVTLRSFDFKKTQTAVSGDAEGSSQHPQDAQEIYEYPGDFIQPSEGQARSRMRLQGERALRRTFSGTGDVLGLACGGVFTLSRSAVERFDREYIIIGLRHRVEAEGHRSGDGRDPRRVEVEAIPSDVAYRPRMVTPRPTTDGVETATVTGPAGKDFLVDEFGRVKVRFHWDRSPDAPGKTSCWMRVSHPSAGEGFGHVTLPRIGQEVVVDFLDGDPDRPIITGRVYNGQKKHTYPLSANETRSLWRSQTVGNPGDYGGAETSPPSTPGFNEIRFEDKGGKEELYVHAQREMVTDVLLDDKLTVQRDRKTRIGRDRTTEIKRHEKVTIEDGDETHTVKSGKRTTAIQQNETLTVEQGNMETKVKMGNVKTEVSMGNMDTKVGMGNVTLKVDLGKVEIEAMQSITLKVGQSSVVIDQVGVTVKGMMVTSEAQIQSQTKGLMVQVEGSAMTVVKGGIVMIN